MMRYMWRGVGISAVVILGSLSGAAAWAAAAPGAANPGVTMLGVEATAAQPVASQPSIEVPARPPMNAPVGNLRIQLNRFSITGNTVFSVQSLNHLIEDMVGKELAFADILRAANRITNFYRDAGYLIARAYVPEQEIQEGVVDIVVVEGLLGEVNVKNDSRLLDSSVSKAVAYMHPGTIVSRKTVEREILLLNDMPGVEANATFKVGRKPGTSDLDLNVSRTRTLTASVDLNNFGNEYTGQQRGGLNLFLNNALGVGDRLALRGLRSGDGGTAYSSAEYSWALGVKGTRMGLRRSNIHSDVGKEFDALGLRSDALVQSAFIARPFVRSRRANLYGLLNYDDKRVRQDFGGPLALSSAHDDLRETTLAFSGDFRDDAFGGGLSTYGVSYGYGSLASGGKFPNSRADADQDFGKYGVSYGRLQYLPGHFSWLLQFNGQFTRDALISSEQFSLGGPSAVRAFPNGEGLGDTGYVVSTELRRDIPIDGRLLKHLQIFGFADYGEAEINSSISAAEVRFDRQGVGLGFKASAVGSYQLGMSYAKAVNDEELVNSDNHQFLLQFTKWFE